MHLFLLGLILCQTNLPTASAQVAVTQAPPATQPQAVPSPVQPPPVVITSQAPPPAVVTSQQPAPQTQAPPPQSQAPPPQSQAPPQPAQTSQPAPQPQASPAQSQQPADASPSPSASIPLSPVGGTATSCDLSCNGICCTAGQTCQDQVCVAVNFPTPSPSTVAAAQSSQDSSGPSAGLIIGIIIPILVVILGCLAFVYYKKRQDRIESKESLLDTFRRASLPKENTVESFSNLPAQGSLSRIVQVQPTLLESVDRSSQTWKELESQISNHNSTLLSLHSIKAADTGFKARAAELKDFGSSYLFHHVGDVYHGLDQVPCGDVYCGLCTISTSGFDIYNPVTRGQGSGLFGDGIYFTMNPVIGLERGVKVVLVCEVLLGNAFYAQATFPAGPVALPPSTHSVYALPDVVKPEGTLLEEEFVVYDSTQVIPVFLCEISKD